MVEIPEMVRGEGFRAQAKGLDFDGSWMAADEGGWAALRAGSSEVRVFYFLRNIETIC